MTAIRVVVVDDQALMRAAFRQILSAHGIEVVGEAATADEAVAEVARTSPDVVGVRYGEREWKQQIEKLIESRQPEIQAILKEFNVPLLDAVAPAPR